ncbi:MAG: ABC transporter ATP-binding protein [Chloroflexota bacterium]|nr:ABC transporter ATP-binding protein [Chloroflexota bacterium]
MSKWFKYYQNGMSEAKAGDRINGQNKPENTKGTLKRILPFLRPHWQIGLLGAALIIITSLLVFPQPLITRFLVDDVILNKRLDLMPLAIILFVGIKAINLGVTLLQRYNLNNFEQYVLLDIQSALLDHTLLLPKTFFDENEIGYLVSRISSDVQGLRWFLSGTVVYLVTNLIQFIGGLGFLFYLEWRLALVSLFILPFLAWVMNHFSKRLRTLSHRGMEQRATIMEKLQETIASMPLIKTFSTETYESQRTRTALENGRQIAMAQSVVSSVANTMITIGPTLARGVVIIIGVYLVVQDLWTLGSLLAFYSYLGLVFSPVLYIASANFSLQSSLAALDRVLRLFDIVPEENLISGMKVNQLSGDIKFDHIDFSYGDDALVLEDISFHIQQGEHVAIIGPSGVGKTTLISLILCLYKPKQGNILFDNLPLSHYHLPSLRRRIGYVSQRTLLLSGSFRENLCYGNPEANPEEIESASRVAGIHDFIMGLPKGYDSKIEERGVNLSEGQKQRLSIARALIKKPDILILDEPTAALDSIVEHSIFESLPQYIQGKTLFIIAHRLATIQHSDRIFLLNEKRLVGVGTHMQLLKNNELYREMIANQELFRTL